MLEVGPDVEGTGRCGEQGCPCEVIGHSSRDPSRGGMVHVLSLGPLTAAYEWASHEETEAKAQGREGGAGRQPLLSPLHCFPGHQCGVPEGASRETESGEGSKSWSRCVGTAQMWEKGLDPLALREGSGAGRDQGSLNAGRKLAK